MNSTFLFDLARCTFSTHFVKLHCQTMQFSTQQTNFYTLLLFISFDAWTSTLHLTEMPILHLILTRGISPVTASNFKLNTSYIFNSTFEFLFTLQWSLVETKDAFTGVGDGDLSTSSPGSLARQHTTPISSQNTACSVKNHAAFLSTSHPHKTLITNQNYWVTINSFLL